MTNAPSSAACLIVISLLHIILRNKEPYGSACPMAITLVISCATPLEDTKYNFASSSESCIPIKTSIDSLVLSKYLWLSLNVRSSKSVIKSSNDLHCEFHQH